MIRLLFGMIACFAWCGFAHAQWSVAPHQMSLWADEDVATLQKWQAQAADMAIGQCAASFRAATALPMPDDPLQRSALARREAMALAQWMAQGCVADKIRAKWQIDDKNDVTDLDSQLDAAVGRGALDTFFANLNPQHPEYLALVGALARETEPAKRQLVLQNLERWRWMPLALGDRYLMVNAANFTLTLWEGGQRVQSWPVIVGKPSTPTPIFAATVTGFILNPWWEIPSSIVAESVGALFRNRPAEARRRGYVFQNGRYRQRPGPGNALGQIKLVMPNPYSVYLHDTPSKQLFDQPVRAFSHGCIRVKDALNLGRALMDGTMSEQQMSTILASRKTTSVELKRSLPVYITYFTAETDADGGLRDLGDVYKRDTLVIARASNSPSECSGNAKRAG